MALFILPLHPLLRAGRYNRVYESKEFKRVRTSGQWSPEAICMLKFSGERIVPEADNCEPLFALKMYQEHIARYLFASQRVSGKSVLDVGCGIGYGSHMLALRGLEMSPHLTFLRRRSNTLVSFIHIHG